MICGFFIATIISLSLANVWTPFQKKSSCNKDFCPEKKLEFGGKIVAFGDYDNDRTFVYFFSRLIIEFRLQSQSTQLVNFSSNQKKMKERKSELNNSQRCKH